MNNHPAFANNKHESGVIFTMENKEQNKNYQNKKEQNEQNKKEQNKNENKSENKNEQ